MRRIVAFYELYWDQAETTKLTLSVDAMFLHLLCEIVQKLNNRVQIFSMYTFFFVTVTVTFTVETNSER